MPQQRPDGSLYPVRESRRLPLVDDIMNLQIVVQSHNLSLLENVFSNGVYPKRGVNKLTRFVFQRNIES
jgi:hypothetical protein